MFVIRLFGMMLICIIMMSVHRQNRPGMVRSLRSVSQPKKSVESYAANLLGMKLQADDHGTDDHATDDHAADDHGTDDHATDDHATDDHATDDHATDDHATDDHAADDHGSDDGHGSDDAEGHASSGGHGEVGVSLFNTLGLIKAEVAMVAIIIIVAAVLALESVFHLLNEFTADTTFHKMVGAVEKELMIVGCTAFIFKIIVNTDASADLSHEWLVALEYADLLVPLFSFANCFIGIMLIFLALRQCDVWSKGFHLQLEAVLEEFEKQRQKLTYKWSLKPINSVVSEMEFRIFHGIFCENFKVQRSAFAFDMYVELVFEKFILEIIKIRIINWVLVIVLLLLNMGRANSKIAFFYCGDTDYLCIQRSAAIVFTLAGVVMLVVTMCVSVISRRYEILIIKKSGVASIDLYPQYLKELEATNDVRHEAARLNKEELKAAVNASRKRMKSMRERQKTIFDYASNPSMFLNTAAETVSKVGRRRSTNRRTGLVVPEHGSGKDEEEIELQKAPKMKPSLSVINEIINSDLSAREHSTPPVVVKQSNSVENLPSENKADDDLNLTNLAMIVPEPHEDAVMDIASQDPPVVTPAAVVVPETPKEEETVGFKPDTPIHADAEKEDRFDPSQRMESQRRYTSVYLNRMVPLAASQASNFLETIFLFNSPALYFEVVRLLIMLIALYMALWLLNFLGSDISGGWKLLTILPALLSSVNYFYIVKTSSLLKAIYKIDNEAVLEVLENTEGSRILGIEIRNKLLKKLEQNSSGESQRTQIRNLFNEIDDNNSGLLSRSEFEVLMRKLDIHFSRKKWKKIYHEMDFNFDDKVSFDEFINFLFPKDSPLEEAPK